MKPLAIIYLDSFNLLYTQIDRAPLQNRDQLSISIGTPETLTGSPPIGLSWRSPDAVQNLMSFAANEAKKVGYDIEVLTEGGTFGKAQKRTELNKGMSLLDSGKAQALISFSQMLPPSFSHDGMPSETVMKRAEENNWRFILINQFADPNISNSLWKTDFLHLTKGDRSFGVVIFAREPYAHGSPVGIDGIE